MAERDDAAGPGEERGGRPMWSGTVSFGLVSIPVQLMPGVRHRRVTLRTLDAEGTPLRRRWACSAEDKPIDPEHIVRGYEIEPGRFVVVDDEELAAVAPEKSRDIDVRRFVELSAIDPTFFDRPYFLLPAGGSTKAYRLLAQTMADTEKAAIATFVMRGKEYLIAIIAEGGLLRAETLRFLEEIRSAEYVGLPKGKSAGASAVKATTRAMRDLYADAVAPAELIDERDRRLLELIAEKDRAGRDVVKAEAAPEPGDGVVIDLMEKLKQSLEARAPKRPKRKRRAA
jgi:DNA end-binding protein Ku